MGALQPTHSMGHAPHRGLSGKSAATMSIVLAVLFPAYVIGAIFMGMGPLGLRNMDEVLVTGWAVVPGVLVLLLFDVPLLIGMWLGVKGSRGGAESAGHAGIWLNGIGLFFTLLPTALGPIIDAWVGAPAWWNWIVILGGVAIVAALVRAALHAAETSPS